jgi:hypothetical protein
LNTNNIKSFAKQARLILMEGVKQRLLYWGFDADGNSTESLETTTGGYIFRTQIFNDDSVPPKWQKLNAKLTNKQAVLDVIEEAAYTWFNRLMAINILEKNGYIPPTLTYADELKTPLLVQNAKRGQHQLKQQKYIDLLQQYLLDDQEEQALSLLLTRLCNNNTLVHDVFGHIDDYTEILLPNNLLQRNGIIDLLNSDLIPDEDYKEVELIGWLYQFYISDKKDEVFKGFKANKKARPEDIPAATQIFTPKWIVKYMVENTVGKIYLDFDKTSDLKSEMKYLVENDTTAEIINYQLSIINSLEELTLIDPASGSGHILVTGFDLLFKMYREQGYTAKNAVTSILKDNLFGLDIDDRAMQLARFAVLLKAAEFYPEILNASDSNPLLLPHIYSFPEAHHFQLDEIQSFLTPQGAGYVAELKEALVLLNQGKNIGAALKIELSPEAHAFITKQCHNWNTQYQEGNLDLLQQDLWNNLKPFLEVLLVMTKKYTAVVANPPYMGQKNMNEELKEFTIAHYPNTKSDLYTIFIEKCLTFLLQDGKLGLINPPSWMFTSSFSLLRINLLNNVTIDSLLNLGRGVFGVDFGSTAYVINNSKNNNSKSIYRNLFREKVTVDTPEQKEKWFFQKDFNSYLSDQNNFLKIKDAPLAFWLPEKIFSLFENLKKMDSFVDIKQGLATGDNGQFRRSWFEISLENTSFCGYDENKKWFPYNSGGQYRKWYGNHDYVVNWSNNGDAIRNFKNDIGKIRSRAQNTSYYFKESGSWSKMTASGLTLRYYPLGFIFDVSGCSFFGNNDDLKYFIGLLNSQLKIPFIDAINQSFNYEVGQISSVPIKIDNSFENVVKEVDFTISISKKDWDSRETSWDFEQSPLLNESNSLKAAYEKWQENVTQGFFQLHENEEELNRIFIGIYGLQEELTPEVALKDITILQEELNGKHLEQLEPLFREQGKNAVVLPIKKEEVISQFISYSIGVFMGRYRLDKPGLHIAHPNPTEEELASYEVSLQGTTQSVEIDEDAIIPLMGSECAFPDDALVRIKNLVHNLWGEETLTENLNFINECVGTDLDKYLNEQFWKDHTSRYKKKPIYWLFCSNPKKPQASAFKVLVYMHRMDKYTVSKIQRQYLHPHQEWIKSERDKLIENESNLNRNELRRLEKLRSWELECRDYNEILKILALQPNSFDLDDGVTVNYEKFDGAVAKI